MTPTNNLKLRIEWDDNYADFRYVLSNEREEVARGSSDWANRIAAHYGLEVPRAGEKDEEA